MTAAPESSAAESSGPPALGAADPFPPAGRDAWRALVVEVLRKAGREVDADDPAAVEAALATPTDDGFAVPGLAGPDDLPDAPAGLPGLPPFVRGARPEGSATAGWLVRQRYAVPAGTAPADGHDVLLAELENGVSSLWLVLGDAGGPPVDALPTLLEGVFLDLAPVALEAGRDGPAAAETLLRLAEEAGAGAIAGSLGLDPLLDRTRGGEALDAAYRDAVVDLSRRAAAEHPGLVTVVADGLPFHEAGGSDGQMLGAALAAGVAAVRTLVDAGLAVDDAFARVEFRLAATADQFGTLALFRAARRCWDRVGEVAGASPAARAMRQHAVTSPAMMTVRDPWVNMLRTTVAAVGAGLGGADAVTVLPFDTALGVPDAFARRIARNTQALVLEESHLADVIDPAGGSWAVESRTDALAHAAWDVFTGLERRGGIAAALDDGSLAADLEATWSAHAARIATRRDPITGVSEFPNLHETLPRREVVPATDRAGGLPRRRWATVFEDLRDRADAAADAGTRPAVLLATIDTPARSTARASFARNLLHAGGVDTVEGPGGTDPDAIAAALREAGTTVAVLASSDRVYAEHATPVAAALTAAGATRVLLAGPPGSEGDADVAGHLFTGCDAAALLHDLLDHLGVS